MPKDSFLTSLIEASNAFDCYDLKNTSNFLDNCINNINLNKISSKNKILVKFCSYDEIAPFVYNQYDKFNIFPTRLASVGGFLGEVSCLIGNISLSNPALADKFSDMIKLNFLCNDKKMIKNAISSYQNMVKESEDIDYMSVLCPMSRVAMLVEPGIIQSEIRIKSKNIFNNKPMDLMFIEVPSFCVEALLKSNNKLTKVAMPPPRYFWQPDSDKIKWTDEQKMQWEQAKQYYDGAITRFNSTKRQYDKLQSELYQLQMFIYMAQMLQRNNPQSFQMGAAQTGPAGPVVPSPTAGAVPMVTAPQYAPQQTPVPMGPVPRATVPSYGMQGRFPYGKSHLKITKKSQIDTKPQDKFDDIMERPNYQIPDPQKYEWWKNALDTINPFGDPYSEGAKTLNRVNLGNQLQEYFTQAGSINEASVRMESQIEQMQNQISQTKSQLSAMGFPIGDFPGVAPQAAPTQPNVPQNNVDEKNIAVIDIPNLITLDTYPGQSRDWNASNAAVPNDLRMGEKVVVLSAPTEYQWGGKTVNWVKVQRVAPDNAGRYQLVGEPMWIDASGINKPLQNGNAPDDLSQAPFQENTVQKKEPWPFVPPQESYEFKPIRTPVAPPQPFVRKYPLVPAQEGYEFKPIRLPK